MISSLPFIGSQVQFTAVQYFSFMSKSQWCKFSLIAGCSDFSKFDLELKTSTIHSETEVPESFTLGM